MLTLRKIEAQSVEKIVFASVALVFDTLISLHDNVEFIVDKSSIFQCNRRNIFSLAALANIFHILDFKLGKIPVARNTAILHIEHKNRKSL